MRATGTPDGSSARKVRAVIEPCGPPVLPGAPSGPPMARRPERPDGQGRGLPEGARIRGLGLVEGLVGLLVLGVLGLLVWGPAHRGRTARGLHLCRVHLLQLHVSLEMYTQDSGGRCPAVAKASTSEATLALLRPVYLSDTRRFVCPRTRDQPPPATNLAQGQVSCAYCQGRNTLAPAAALLLSDEQVNIPKNRMTLYFRPMGVPRETTTVLPGGMSCCGTVPYGSVRRGPRLRCVGKQSVCSF